MKKKPKSNWFQNRLTENPKEYFNEKDYIKTEENQFYNLKETVMKVRTKEDLIDDNNINISIFSKNVKEKLDYFLRHWKENMKISIKSTEFNEKREKELDYLLSVENYFRISKELDILKLILLDSDQYLVFELLSLLIYPGEGNDYLRTREYNKNKNYFIPLKNIFQRKNNVDKKLIKLF